MTTITQIGRLLRNAVADSPEVAKVAWNQGDTLLVEFPDGTEFAVELSQLDHNGMSPREAIRHETFRLALEENVALRDKQRRSLKRRRTHAGRDHQNPPRLP